MYLIDISRNGKPSYDARVNQSLDNYFVNDLKLPGHGFMFYINKPSVIIGRNQNVWAEVDIDYLHEHDIELVRRTSGGGAVYHDMGNFIFENILTDNADDFGDYGHFAEPVLKALRKLNIDVKMRENSSDLILDGKKWSGMTMFKSGQGLAAGGTIMYNLNIENARKVLTEDQMEIQKGLGVRSKRSPIVNLKDFLPDGMTMADFREYLLKDFFEQVFTEISHRHPIRKKVLTEDQMEIQKGLGVRSKRSPIVNLKDFLPDGMTMADFREYLLKEIFEVKSLDDIETYHMTDQDWEVADKRLAETYGTDAWNFGHNPGYYDYADTEFDQGKLGINWTIDDGKLSHLKFNPFFKIDGDLNAIEAALSGKKPSRWNVKRAVKKAGIETVDEERLTDFLMSSFDKSE